MLDKLRAEVISSIAAWRQGSPALAHGRLGVLGLQSLRRCCRLTARLHKPGVPARGASPRWQMYRLDVEALGSATFWGRILSLGHLFKGGNLWFPPFRRFGFPARSASRHAGFQSYGCDPQLAVWASGPRVICVGLVPSAFIE